jgi:hypothetical protein
MANSNLILEDDFFLAENLRKMGRLHLCQYLGLSEGGLAVRYREFFYDGSHSDGWQDREWVESCLIGKVRTRRALQVIDELNARLEAA